MRKVITRDNYKPSKGRKFTGKSQTVQCDAVSLGRLLEKAANGMGVPGRQGVFGDEDEDGIDLQKYTHMDPVDKEFVKEGIKAMTERLRALEEEFRAEKEALNKPQESAQEKP